MSFSEIVTVFGKFETRKYSGGLILTFKGSSVSSVVGMKFGKEAQNLNIKAGLTPFKAELEAMKGGLGNEQADELKNKLSDHFSTAFSREKIDKISRLYSTSRDEFLKNILIRDIILDDLRDIFDDVSVHLEILTTEGNDTGALQGQKGSSEAKEDGGTERAAIARMIVNPVIDPAAGVPASRLKPGMVAYFKARSDADYSKLSLGFTEDNEPDKGKQTFRARLEAFEVQNKPEIGEVRAVGTSVIGDNVVGFECSADLKVKVLAEEKSQGSEDDDSFEDDGEGGIGNHIITGVIGLLIILVVALLYAILN